MCADVVLPLPERRLIQLGEGILPGVLTTVSFHCLAAHHVHNLDVGSPGILVHIEVAIHVGEPLSTHNGVEQHDVGDKGDSSVAPDSSLPPFGQMAASWGLAAQAYIIPSG